MNLDTPSPETVGRTLDEVLAWSRNQGWKGWNKHDGLNSPVLGALLGWGRWPRMVAIQGVMRSPVNLRPLLLVPRVYNPKGLALFAQAYLDRYRSRGERGDLAEAERLLKLLDDLRSTGPWSGACWGYQYPWQDPGFYAPTATPNAVVTAFVCEAYLDGFRVTGRGDYLATVASAARFFRKDLKILKDEADELCLSYMPLPMTMRVMDVSILIGAVLAQLEALTGEKDGRGTADRLVTYVLRRQTAEGAWFYTDPPGDSHIRHDNYHTGFILDALERYMSARESVGGEAALEAGLKFYAERLFNHDGSPRWMADQDFPHDVHGAAQGILTFARHPEQYPGMADRILGWTLAHLYGGNGRFHYQQHRHHTRRFTLLRWCNAWMARALTAYECRQAERAMRQMQAAPVTGKGGAGH